MNPNILNLLCRELNINNLQQKKILQKTVYILSKMGLDLGYDYNWYLHGPYSPSLAEDAYELSSNKSYYDNEIEGFEFKQRAKEVIDRFNSIFSDKKDDEDWLELVASLLFLKDNYGENGDALKNLLLSKKERFRAKEDLVDDAIEFVNKYFIPKKKCD